MEHPTLTVDVIWMPTSKRWLVKARLWSDDMPGPTYTLNLNVDNAVALDQSVAAMITSAVRRTLEEALPF